MKQMAQKLFARLFHRLRKNLSTGIQLKDLLQDSPKMARQEYDRHLRTLGDRFARGDGI